MRKVLPALILFGLLVFPVSGVFAQAQDEQVRPKDVICEDVSHDLTRYIAGCEPGGLDSVAETEQQLCCLLNLMETIVDWMFLVLLVVAGAIIIIGAYQFLTASGMPEKVNSARDKLIWALVGVAVAFLAKGLVRLVEMLLT